MDFITKKHRGVLYALLGFALAVSATPTTNPVHHDHTGVGDGGLILGDSEEIFIPTTTATTPPPNHVTRGVVRSQRPACPINILDLISTRCSELSTDDDKWHCVLQITDQCGDLEFLRIAGEPYVTFFNVYKNWYEKKSKGGNSNSRAASDDFPYCWTPWGGSCSN